MAPIHDGDFGPFSGSERDEVVWGTYRRTGTWAPELVALLRRLLGRDGGTLIDVGANVGLVAIPVLAGSGARCIAVEPAPDNLKHLIRNLAAHGLAERAEVHPVALWDVPGQVPMELSPHNSGDNRLAPTGGAGETVMVPAGPLDALLEGRPLAAPCVMKVDTQGAEARVLAGAAQTLKQVDYLIVEYWPAGLRRMGDDVKRLQAALSVFSHAVVLDQAQPPQALAPLTEVLESLAWIPDDGSDEGFFDLLLGRGPELAPTL